MVAEISFKIDELRDYAAAAGLGLSLVVKEAFLFELMETMGSDGFVLKGGTAINKGFMSGHQRFSEDLDYDTDLGRQKARQHVMSLGWKVKKEFFTRNSIGFMMQYNFDKINDVVRLDISFGIKGKTERRKLTSDFLPVSKTTVIYDFKELNQQKESAFEERLEWKDLYDIYWMSLLYKSDFKIRNKDRFTDALSRVSVPKIANAYVPVQKRPNWKAVIEELEQLIHK